ncbi:copper type II ascorbate-dependent monooxygenase domain protein [Ostertagia ostertagi]
MTRFLVGFEPLANADRIHHILLFGCTEPAHATGFWKAPSLDLPNNVGFSIGHESDNIRYLVMQVHYAQPFAGDVKDFSGVTLHITQKQPQNLAAVLLFVSGESIPPGKSQVQINVSCEYGGTTEMHPFAFRTHAHAMGRVISAFYKHEGQWTKIGVRNPQWPQLFEKITTSPVIRKGDLMAATCRFDSHDKTKPVAMGWVQVKLLPNSSILRGWWLFDYS